jgi:hypothetical protein
MDSLLVGGYLAIGTAVYGANAIYNYFLFN